MMVGFPFYDIASYVTVCFYATDKFYCVVIGSYTRILIIINFVHIFIYMFV